MFPMHPNQTPFPVKLYHVTLSLTIRFLCDNAALGAIHAISVVQQSKDFHPLFLPKIDGLQTETDPQGLQSLPPSKHNRFLNFWLPAFSVLICPRPRNDPLIKRIVEELWNSRGISQPVLDFRFADLASMPSSATENGDVLIVVPNGTVLPRLFLWHPGELIRDTCELSTGPYCILPTFNSVISSFDFTYTVE